MAQFAFSPRDIDSIIAHKGLDIFVFRQDIKDRTLRICGLKTNFARVFSTFSQISHPLPLTDCPLFFILECLERLLCLFTSNLFV